MALNLLDKRIAIVTGASREKGIGAAISRALAVQGIDIFFTHWRSFDSMMPHGVDEDGPAKLQQELQELGVRSENLEVDLSTVGAPKRILDEVEVKLGPPSILVNNAAYSTRDGFEILDAATRSEEHTSELQSHVNLVCRLLLEKKNKNQ